MKKLACLFLILILNNCRYPLLYIRVIETSIKVIDVKFLLPKGNFSYLNYAASFDFYYPRYGFQVILKDEKFLQEFKSILLQKKEKPLRYDFNTWIKLEIEYKNGITDSMYMSYFMEGYYYNNKRIGHCGELNRILYEELKNQFNNHKINCFGEFCDSNQIETCIGLLHTTQYKRKFVKKILELDKDNN